MTITVHPVNAVTGAPAYSGKTARQAMGTAYAGATTARPLGAMSGVRPGTPTGTVTATPTVWTVNPHAGILDLQTSATAGPYQYAIDAAVTGAVTAANATNPRKDIVYVKLDDPAEADGSAVPAVTVLYLAGTAAAVPAPPATPARSMVLAVINVPVSGGGSPTVTFTAPRLTAAGGIYPCRTTTERDAITWATAESPLWADVAGALYRNAGAGWVAAATATATRAWTFDRTSSGALGTSTGFTAAVDTQLAVGTIADCPAGTYLILANVGLLGTVVSAASLRVRAGSTVLNESRADVETTVTRFFQITGSHVHTGGALTVDLRATVSSGSPTVQNAGSTTIKVAYLG